MRADQERNLPRYLLFTETLPTPALCATAASSATNGLPMERTIKVDRVGYVARASSHELHEPRKRRPDGGKRSPNSFGSALGEPAPGKMGQRRSCRQWRWNGSATATANGRPWGSRDSARRCRAAMRDEGQRWPEFCRGKEAVQTYPDSDERYNEETTAVTSPFQRFCCTVFKVPK